MNNNLINQITYLTNKKTVDAVFTLSQTVKRLCDENGQPDKLEVYQYVNESIPEKLNQMNVAIQSLLPQIIDTRIDLVSANEEIEDLEKEIKAMKANILELEHSYQVKLTELRQQNQSVNINKIQYEDLVASMMDFRDQMTFYKDNANSMDINTMLDQLYQEAGRILTNSGVELLNSMGFYSSEKQVVKETVKTEFAELVDTIHSSVRDGYRLDGKVVRPQEIVLYVE